MSGRKPEVFFCFPFPVECLAGPAPLSWWGNLQ